jgi:hypothetical protein
VNDNNGIDRKRLLADHAVDPTRMAQRRALVAALRAASAAAEPVAGRVRPPADDERRGGHRRAMVAAAALAIDPNPLRGAALQLAERRDATGFDLGSHSAMPMRF